MDDWGIVSRRQRDGGESSIWCGMIRLRRMSHLVRYEVRDRVALITVDNEGARVPEEGQATRASDIDVMFADYRRPSSLLEKLAFEGHAFHGGAT